MLAILKSVNYRAWYAIAEFVDNALQSYLTHFDELIQIEGEKFCLEVRIESDGQEKITIRDNAAGIYSDDFPRAFRPASLPKDRSGLSEFGMGMKSAACWFANYWTVRTSALGEPIERLVVFDVEHIVEQQIEDVAIQSRPIDPNTHFTEITLTQLHQMPQKKTVAKIKSHLASMYRVFLREGKLKLYFNGEAIKYSDPKILAAPFHKIPENPPVIWCKNIDLEIEPGLRIHGFAAILDKGSTANAGFALLRRNRVILGSDDEGYRPSEIFGASNTFVYQRLFGELHLDGFDVSHTKDGFRWNHHEEQILILLKKALNEPPLSLIDQAREYRSRSKPEGTKPGVPAPAFVTTNGTTPQPVPVGASPGGSLGNGNTSLFGGRSSVPALTPQAQTNGVPSPPPPQPTVPSVTRRSMIVPLNNDVWSVSIEISSDPSIGEWFSIYELADERFQIGVRVANAHPFTEKFVGHDAQCLEPLLRLAIGMCLAEITARQSGTRQAGTFRSVVNELLRKSLVEA